MPPDLLFWIAMLAGTCVIIRYVCGKAGVVFVLIAGTALVVGGVVRNQLGRAAEGIYAALIVMAGVGFYIARKKRGKDDRR